MKPKGMKFKKKRMDIDAFIEDELNNINAGSGSKPMTLSKSGVKTKKKNQSLIKPTFAGKKIKKKAPEIREPLVLDEPEPFSKPKLTSIQKGPVVPLKIRNKEGMQPIQMPVTEPPEKLKRPQGPSKLLELQSRAKNRPMDEHLPVDDQEASDYDDSFEKEYDEDEFESDDDK